MAPDKVRRSAYDAALALLARREHGRGELQVKLVKRDYVAEEIDVALEQLTGQGYQSDQRFAESYVRERTQRGYGAFRIRGELASRGLGSAEIEESLQPYDGCWAELLEQAYLRRYGAASIAGRGDWLKRARFLEGRGFESSAIRRLLDSHKSH